MEVKNSAKPAGPLHLKYVPGLLHVEADLPRRCGGFLACTAALTIDTVVAAASVDVAANCRGVVVEPSVHLHLVVEQRPALGTVRVAAHPENPTLPSANCEKEIMSHIYKQQRQTPRSITYIAKRISLLESKLLVTPRTWQSRAK
jgi:hypothetical protein